MKSSRGEIKICDILDMAGLKYIEEYTFKDLVSSNGRPLRFDFAVFDDSAFSVFPHEDREERMQAIEKAEIKSFFIF